MPAADSGAPIDFPTAVAALGCAARLGNLHELSRWLAVGGGAILDEPSGDEGWHALHEAAMAGHAAVLERLLLSGAGVNGREGVGRTPLHWAALGGHVPAAKVLLEHGGDPNARDISMSAPLQGVAIHGHVELAAMLLDARAEIDAGDSWQQTLLHTAVIEGRVELVRFLCAQGAPINVADAEGMAPVHRALLLAQAGRPGSHEILATLVEHGAA